MTTSAIAVTEGSGKNVWTDQRTVSAVAREAQYILLAEPALPTYIIQGTNISAATTGDHALQVMAGASLYVRIFRITVVQAGLATAANEVGIDVIRLTTAGTDGDAVTARPLDSGDAAAGATGMTLPPVKGTEGVTLFRRRLMATQAASYPVAGDISPYWEWEASARGKPIVIPAGTTNGIALKVVTGRAAATLDLMVEFTETAWL